MRTKEFLSSHNIDHDSIDIQSDPTGFALLQSLGAKSVPVVSRGEDFVFGQSIGDVAEFLGIDVDTRPQLSPAQLVEKLELIVSAAQRYVGQFPPEAADQDVLDRRRTHRQLSFHVFRVVEALIVCAQGRELTYQYYADQPPDEMIHFDQIAGYGGEVRQKLLDWWAGVEDRDCQGPVQTYFGEKPLHEVMERTTWHAGQHVRQFMMLLERMDIEPDQPLTPEDFAGLPMPQKVWDDE